MQKILGMTLMVLGMCGAALAQNQVPEIDAATVASAVALIGGAVLVIRTRKK